MPAPTALLTSSETIHAVPGEPRGVVVSFARAARRGTKGGLGEPVAAAASLTRLGFSERGREGRRLHT